MIIWTGGLRHLSGLPHLPKVPHLRVNRPLEVKMAPRVTENNTYAKLWSDQQSVLWYLVVFFVVVNIFCSLHDLHV